MGKRGPKPQGKVSIIWSPEFAYALGLLATDGNLSKDGRHLDLTSKDKDQILTFKRCLGLNNKIRHKKSSYNGERKYCSIQFGDVLFYQWLLRLGFTPNKSKTLGRLNIPRKYFFDFLRGCFDGDGSIYAYWDPRWHSSYMFYLQFASASPQFLFFLRDIIDQLLSIRGKISSFSTPKARSTQQLRFAKEGTLALLRQMYYAEYVPRLERKYLKAQAILEIDRVHNNAQVRKLVDRYA